MAMITGAILFGAVGKNSEIDTLSREVDRLQNAVDSWNNWMLWAVGFAAIAAVFLFLTTRLAIVRTRQLTVAQGLLDAAKDRNSQEAIAGANEGANKANERAMVAEKRAAEANQRAHELEQGNLGLQRDVATLRGKAAEQEERAANAETELANLRNAARPRRLRDDQKSALIAALTGDPKGEVSIFCVMGDGEGNALANDINDVLKAAGWSVKGGGVNQAAYGGGDPVGFVILVHSADTAPLYAGRLQRAFISIGIPLAGQVLASVPAGEVQIIVGHKPNTIE